jgi:hypothetical protein
LPDQTDNVCCVPSRKQSRHPASQRSEKRSVGCSLMPTPPQSQQHFAGSRFPASSRQRERHFSDSTTAERRAWAATRWQHGRVRQTCPQPAAVVSDQFGFTSEFGCFCPLQCSLRNGGGQKWPISRLLAGVPAPTSATGGASRRNADVLPVRSIAGYC